LFLFINSLAAAGTEFSRAEEMYNRAQYQAAVEILKPYPTQPEALRLTGRSFFWEISKRRFSISRNWWG
jgi:hypothetical protein